MSSFQHQNPEMDRGQFVISLDFELMWGMRDHVTIADYGDAITGGRRAIAEILTLFGNRGIAATWAVVGILFARDKAHLLQSLPDLRPNYRDSKLDPYPVIDTLKDNEADEPMWMGRSLVEEIKKTPRQELGTHSFSHYYALEHNRNPNAYRADLQAAQKIASEQDIETESIIFARNQYGSDELALVDELGIKAYRGNARNWIYSPDDNMPKPLLILKRSMRLIDALIPTGFDSSWRYGVTRKTLANIPASRFLRIFSMPLLARLHLKRIKSEMTSAAKKGKLYHLWWHPHNFGRNQIFALATLDEILVHYQYLAQKFGMQNFTMAQLAKAQFSADMTEDAA